MLEQMLLADEVTSLKEKLSSKALSFETKMEP